MSRHECDCGVVYTELEHIYACQANEHWRPKKLPLFEARIVCDSPRDLVQVIMRIGPKESNLRCGTGSTIHEAVSELADDIMRKALLVDDDRMRVTLEGDREP